MEIPHSSKVTTGGRVRFWHRPDWHSSDAFWIALAPLLVLGALGWWLLQLMHGHRLDGVMLRATGLGLLAIGIAVVTLYVLFINDRRVRGLCPICRNVQEWNPDNPSCECVHCMAAMHVGRDGTIREVSLDDMGGYFVDSTDFKDAVASDGHVTVVMPAICAVCGEQPTTSGKTKDWAVGELHSEGVDAITAQDFAAVAVPLCTSHRDQAPVQVDRYVVSLRFDSYRYYRAFLLVNGLPRQRAAAPVAQIEKPASASGDLQPLLCPSCGAPLPVSEGNETACLACGHKAELPEPYMQLRAAKRMSDEDAAQLHALATEIARPPPAWKRTAMITGYAVGGATLVVMAIGSIVGAVAGAVAGSQLGDTVAKLFAIVGAVAVGIVALPYVGEWVAAVAVLHHTSVASDIVAGAAPAYRYDLIAAAMLYGLGVVPIAVALRTHDNLSAIVDLQGKLAAQHSPVAGGALCCRHCGAALDVAHDAMVARCLFCGADNLLTVPADLAAKHKDHAKDLDAKVQDAVMKHDIARDEARARMWAMIVGGLLLAPYVCLAGYVLHHFFFG